MNRRSKYFHRPFIHPCSQSIHVVVRPQEPAVSGEIADLHQTSVPEHRAVSKSTNFEKQRRHFFSIWFHMNLVFLLSWIVLIKKLLLISFPLFFFTSFMLLCTNMIYLYISILFLIFFCVQNAEILTTKRTD